MKNHGKTMKPHALPMRPKATFLPSAEDEDLQRELAALQRCDAILAISRHEERLLVETYGLPRWKAALGEGMRMLTDWWFGRFLYIFYFSIYWE